MNDFHGLLSSDFGFNPQGKSAPMAPPKPNLTTNSAFNFEIGGTATARPGSISKSSSGPFLDDHDTLFRPNNNLKSHEFSDLGGFDDAFGGNNSKTAGTSSVNLDSIFTGSGDSGPKFSSLPVYDKPVFDDDAFDGVSGLKCSNSAKHEYILSSSSKKNDAFDDLLGGLGRKEPEPKGFTGSGARGADKGIPGFDDLLPGFGGNSAQSQSTSSDSSWHHRSTAHATKKTSSAMDDPFVVLESTSSPAPSSSGFFNDPLGKISNLNSSSTKSASGGLFDEIDHLDGLGKTVPAFKSEMNDREKEGSHLRTGRRAAGRQNSASVEASDKSHGRSPDRVQEKRMPAEDFQDSPRNLFDMPSVSADSHRSVPNAPPPSYRNASSGETNAQEQTSPKYEENLDSSGDIWLTVSEIPLFTQPTAAPPPARPPPRRPARFFRAGAAAHAKKKVDEYSAFPSSTMFFPSAKSVPDGEKNSFVSPIDEREDFSRGKSQNNVHGSSDVLTGEDMETNSDAAASAAAMKDAMDRAEAKFRHAKEVRERENAKAARVQQERGEKTVQDAQKSVFRDSQERLERERQQREREREEEERGHKEEEERWRIEREREEKEREQRRLERERELARQAVERATREARERAAAEARARAERAAVEKAQAEARERAERAAVQRVQAEARERAAQEAKEKAEKAAAEARERDKEAHERAAAAAAAKANQQKNEYDLDSLLSMGSRPSSVPRPRASHSDPVFDTQFQSKQAKESVRAFDGSTANMRKASLSASMVDDLNSIFGASPSAEEFQEAEGESEERQRARLERHQRTQERARKALEEKNQRDHQAQMEQAERHRIAETLDVEIKKWAAGKEGNLRALLSTLHNVLWPGCGWQPAPITDLITAASVKKVYRKATLCIHPDKVQQKGATLQQKYIAEKVFDILKEAWNKFNSEELF